MHRTGFFLLWKKGFCRACGVYLIAVLLDRRILLVWEAQWAGRNLGKLAVERFCFRFVGRCGWPVAFIVPDLVALRKRSEVESADLEAAYCWAGAKNDSALVTYFSGLNGRWMNAGVACSKAEGWDGYRPLESRNDSWPHDRIVTKRDGGFLEGLFSIFGHVSLCQWAAQRGKE